MCGIKVAVLEYLIFICKESLDSPASQSRDARPKGRFLRRDLVRAQEGVTPPSSVRMNRTQPIIVRDRL